MSRRPRSLGALLLGSSARVAVPLVATVLMALGGHLVVQRELTALADRVEPLGRANAEALQLLTDAETGARGFQLTGKPVFLEPYHRGLLEYPVAERRARAAAGGDRTTLALLDTQERAVRTWLDRIGAPGAAGRPTDQVLGKRLFDRVRQANRAVADHARSRRDEAYQRSEKVFYLSLGLLALGALLAVAYSVHTAGRMTRSVTAPVLDLVDTLGRLAGGDLSARAAVTGPVEFRQVAESVNHLAERAGRTAARDAELQRRDDLLLAVERGMRERVDPAGVLAVATATLGPGLGVDRVYVRLSEDGLTGAAVAVWPADDPPPATLPGVRPWEPEASPVAVFAVEDTEREPAMPADWRAYVLGLGIRAYLDAPLRAGQETLGYLTIQCRNPRAWSEADRTLVGAAGREMALALAQARTADRLREAVERLTALDRIREAFVSTVSHELRTPLTSIAGYLELLLDRSAGPLTQRQAHMLSVVNRNTDRLRTLIDDLLTLSSVDAGRFELTTAPLDLRDVVAATVTAMGPVARASGLTLLSRLPDHPLPVDGDQASLERAVLNVLSNAVKYTPAGGSVTVTGRLDGPEAAVSIADTGIGIPAADQEQLFSRFFRASNARERNLPGTGLGLALVRELLERQHGTVEMSSREGIGTTVTLRLPIRESRNAAAPAGVP